MRRLAAVLSVFLVLAAGDARAGFDEGLAAYERGDYATALRELRPLAEQDAAAQFLLGLMYDEGRGVPQD
jgi:TPR repeat protein